MNELPLLDVLGMRSKLPNKDTKKHRYPHYLGVELELENVSGRLLEEPAPRGWTTHHDDSLRNGGLEFVFTGPYDGDHAMQAVDNFFKVEGNYVGGARTSTHVHVNAGGLTVGQFRAICALSYIIEDALFHAIKMPRKWCGYCMPLTEMSNARLRSLLLNQQPNEFAAFGVRPAHNADKYYGMNVSSLAKHGTLEFRYFPGAPQQDELLSWMDYCTELVSAGISINSLDTFVRTNSERDLRELLIGSFPTWGERLINTVGMPALYEHLRDLQCLLEKEEAALVKRNDPLVFVSPQLVGLACRVYGINKESRDKIATTLQALKVMSRTEWMEQIVHGGWQNKASNIEAYASAPEGWNRYAQVDLAATAAMEARLIRVGVAAPRGLGPEAYHVPAVAPDQPDDNF